MSEAHEKGKLEGNKFYKPGVVDVMDEARSHSISDLENASKENNVDDIVKILTSGKKHSYERELKKRGISREDTVRYKNVLEYSISWLLDKRPFYGYLFQDVVRRSTFDVDTLAVYVKDSRIVLLYNPDFLSLHNLKQNVGFMQHEMGHVIHGHVKLHKKLNKDVISDPVFGLAIDLAVDSCIQDDGDQPDWVLMPKNLRIPEEGVPEDKWKNFQEHQTWEYYFDLLREMRENSPQQFKSQIGDKAALRPGSDPGADEGRDPLTGGDHRYSAGEGSDSADVQDEVIRAAMSNAYTKAEQHAKTNMHGYMKGHLIDMIASLFKEKSVPFERILRRFVGSHVKVGKRSTMIKLSKRRKCPPGKTFERSLRVLWAQDDSGSVAMEERALCRSELFHLNQSTNVTVLFQRFTYGLVGPLLDLDQDPFSKAMEQYDGGTDFQDVCDLADRLDVDLLLIGTDGYAPTPRKPKTPVGWILTSDGKSHDFGTVIRMPTIEDIRSGHKAVIEKW